MLNSPSQDFSENAATVETNPELQHGTSTPPMNPEYIPPYEDDDDNSSWSSVLPPLPEDNEEAAAVVTTTEHSRPSDDPSDDLHSERCPSVIEVDPEKGTIRVEEEQETEEQSEAPQPLLTQVQQCWLIVFFRKWANKTKTRSRNTFKKYGPKVKRAAKRSATVIKDASVRSASFVAAKSSELKVRAVEFSATHDLPNKARKSVETVKKASTETAKGVKRASVATLKGMKEFESKHKLVSKSKRGLSKGGKFIRKAWMGETVNREQENNTTSTKEVCEPVPAKVPPSSE